MGIEVDLTGQVLDLQPPDVVLEERDRHDQRDPADAVLLDDREQLGAGVLIDRLS